MCVQWWRYWRIWFSYQMPQTLLYTFWCLWITNLLKLQTWWPILWEPLFCSRYLVDSLVIHSSLDSKPSSSFVQLSCWYVILQFCLFLFNFCSHGHVVLRNWKFEIVQRPFLFVLMCMSYCEWNMNKTFGGNHKSSQSFLLGSILYSWY